MKRIVLFLLIALVLLVSCNQDEVHEHKFDEGTVTTAPTCTQNGVKTFKCKCGETKTEIVDALGHDIEDVAAKAATCTEVGWNEYEKCKREGCDYTTYVEIAANGHTEGTSETTAATCAAEGSTVVKAARDAMNGWDPSGGAIYYYNPNTATNKWIWSRTTIKVIGKHKFCK